MGFGLQDEGADRTSLSSLTVGELKDIIAQAVRGEEGAGVELAGKWEGGELILKPHGEGLQSKTIPMDVFFHKIVMVRDRLRVLEQKLNGHPKLSEAEKVELQQYITRAYGSLTTLNALFKHRADQFRGEAG
ncbi:MAG: hypothetical protein GF355_03800 [Candidatus Eisenbacteria bacterium]|nr:hypothetical protein [Candidatus Eisenbacteria bacterium]